MTFNLTLAQAMAGAVRDGDAGAALAPADLFAENRDKFVAGLPGTLLLWNDRDGATLTENCMPDRKVNGDSPGAAAGRATCRTQSATTP